MDYCDAMFDAIWVHELNMNDPATAAEALRKAGFDPQALAALAGEQATKDALKAATQEAVDRGVFGAPTFFVGDRMFWGQDRMDFVKDALRSAG
jgi:2-hydroxychromene-2-carboxylate isomerase